MNAGQIPEPYEISLRSKALENFVNVDKADLEKMFEAYCDADGHLDFEDAIQFADVVQGEIITKNIEWIVELIDRSMT